MNDSELDRRLRAWSAPEMPADALRREVWQRIAAQGEDTAPSAALRWLDALLRPRRALAALAAALAVGTAGGIAHAALQPKTAPHSLADATGAYVQSINPLHPGHLPHGGAHLK